MTIKPTKETILRNLRRRFTYKSDTGWLDHWRVTAAGKPVEDDCDGFALTLLYDLEERSWARFWWSLITFRAVLWQVKAADTGDGHLVLWYKGAWSDNTVSKWYKTKDMRHKRRFPYPWPFVMFKMLIGKFL